MSAATNTNIEPTGEVGVDEMRDAIVGDGTSHGYMYDIIALVQACYGSTDTIGHLNGWLTASGRSKYEAFKQEISRTHGRKNQAKVKIRWTKDLLRRCKSEPVLNVSACKAEDFMGFLQSQRDSNGNLLSKSAYQNKCAALFHLFRCHDGLEGFPPAFDRALKSLKVGFFRILTTKLQDEGSNKTETGKKPMSYQLYTKCCEWFLNEGTLAGIFGYCFLVLTWNLMCRVNNTTRILFEHISWEWDHLEVLFAQQKGDTQGLTSKYPRRLFCNPSNPIVCPIFALALYLATFGANVQKSSRLFPGRSQYKRFADSLEALLKKHEDELVAMGYTSHRDIGTHSIRKGAAKWLSGQPGGPSTVAICIRAGWTLGGVKDVYLTYEAEGDAFCGRMLALLPLLSADFAAGPPELCDIDAAMLTQQTKEVFPAFAQVDSFSGVTMQCLAVLANAKATVEKLPIGHIVRQNNHLFTNQVMLDMLSGAAQVKYPWENGQATMTFGSGIPPHVALLVRQKVLLDFACGFDSRMKALLNEIFDDRNLANNSMSSYQIRNIVDERLSNGLERYHTLLREELRRFAANASGAPIIETSTLPTNNSQSTPGARFQAHYYNGGFHRLPLGYAYPKGTIRDLWRRWNVGDTVNNVPPLKILKREDFQNVEGAKRDYRKIYYDLKLVCTHIESQLQASGVDLSSISSDNEWIGLLDTVATRENGLVAGNNRASQTQWRSVVRKITKIRASAAADSSSSTGQQKNRGRPRTRANSSSQQPSRRPRGRPRGTRNKATLQEHQNTTPDTDDFNNAGDFEEIEREPAEVVPVTKRGKCKVDPCLDHSGVLFRECDGDDCTNYVHRSPCAEAKNLWFGSLGGKDERVFCSRLCAPLDIRPPREDSVAKKKRQGKKRKKTTGKSRSKSSTSSKRQKSAATTIDTSTIDRQQSSKKVAVSKTAGECSIVPCTFPTCHPDHPCACCGFGVHNLCAGAQDLHDDDNEVYMYCSRECKRQGRPP